MRRQFVVLCSLCAALCAVALGTASAAGDGATLGQVVPGNAPCGAPESIIVAQTATSGGVSYEVPAGKWRVIWWAAAGSPTGHIALVIFRPTGNPNEFRIVGSAAPRSLPEPKNKFPATIKVRGGDLVGFWAEPNTICGVSTGDPGDTASIYFPVA